MSAVERPRGATRSFAAAGALGMLGMLCVLACAFLSGCNRLMWRKQFELPGAAWINRERVVEIVVEYEEKLPWSLLAGTTLKRGYRFTLRELRVTPDGKVALLSESPAVVGYPEGSVYEFIGELVVLRAAAPGAGETRGADTPSGRAAPDRRLEVITWKPGAAAVTVRGNLLPGGAGLSEILASPDRTKLALVAAEGESGRLWIIDGWPSRDVTGGTTVLGLTDLLWSNLGNALLLRTAGGVEQWDGINRPIKATAFPRCFRPRTSHGSHISDEGLSFYRATLAAAPEIKKIPGWTAHARMDLVKRIEEIGRGCM